MEEEHASLFAPVGVRHTVNHTVNHTFNDIVIGDSTRRRLWNPGMSTTGSRHEVQRSLPVLIAECRSAPGTAMQIAMAETQRQEAQHDLSGVTPGEGSRRQKRNAEQCTTGKLSYQGKLATSAPSCRLAPALNRNACTNAMRACVSRCSRPVATSSVWLLVLRVGKFLFRSTPFL